MKKMLVISLAILATGCSNNKSMFVDYGGKNTQEIQKVDPSIDFQTLKATPLCCDLLSELNYQEITEPGKFDFAITSQSQAFNFTTGKSFVKGISLPATDEVIKIAISSPIVASVFVPTILILDEQHKPLQLYSEETIKYDSGSLLNADRLFANIELPTAFADGRRARYLLILTTEEAMQGTTKLPAPEQSAAEVGRADAVYKMYNNEPLPHTATGVVRLAFDYKPSSRTSAKGIVAEAPTGSKKAQSMVAGEGVAAAVTTGVVINTTIQPESEAMFLTLIEQAVKDGDYKKAIRFVEEAERAGSTKAQDALIKAMKKYQ